MERPKEGEYNPLFNTYLRLVPEGDFFTLLNENTEKLRSFFEKIGQDREDYSYAPGKWTIRQVLLHINDTERVMSFRALVAARGDNRAILPNMDQDLYAENAEVNGRSLAMLLDEFLAIRKLSTILFRNISAEKATWRVNVNGHPTSPRALGYVIIGHGLHHLKILDEKYLIG
jgi:DinB superfamily